MSTPSFDPDRIHEIARRAGAERSLYMGEAIGHGLAIAWEGLAALGTWLRGRGRAKTPAVTNRYNS